MSREFRDFDKQTLCSDLVWDKKNRARHQAGLTSRILGSCHREGKVCLKRLDIVSLYLALGKGVVYFKATTRYRETFQNSSGLVISRFALLLSSPSTTL